MKKLTKKEAIKLHRKLWNWVADETLRLKRKVKKEEYFYRNHIDREDIPKNKCYCCEYDEQKQDKCTNKSCKYCPISWGNRDNDCEKPSYYSEWNYAIDYKEAAEYARKIANLSERKNYDNEE